MTAADSFAANVRAAWNGQMDFAQLVGCAGTLEALGDWVLSATLYRTWTRRNSSPYAYAAYFNCGVALNNAGDVEGAIEAYRQAISVAPDFIQARINLGLLHERQGDFQSAIASWRWVGDNTAKLTNETRPLIQIALNHMARVQEGRKLFQSASDCLTQSLMLEPNQPDAIHHWVFLRGRQCAWPIYTPLPGVSPEFMKESTSALAMISISDEPEEQLAAARRYVARHVRTDLSRLSPEHGYRHEKIRIGYCSSDFCLHPVSMLMAEVFELHDRDRFEVYGYCWSPEDGSALRQRVVSSLDKFTRIDTLSDAQAANLIREHEIDILVDLQGQTAGARANIFSYRPAPVQITYLGLPATTGLPSIDYVIADRFLIPPESAPYYSEKPLYLPDIYQASDRKRVIGPIPSRKSCGLPDSGFVFCSFNNSFKYTSAMFDVWMRILDQVPGSVLWLLGDNPWAEQNLRREAASRGVAQERLIFADRVAPADYLARLQVADLFLDTFPFNAGTTANDCLWAGLPILTMTGRSFASRMAGALLTAARLPELITYSVGDYETRAVELATRPGQLSGLRSRLAAEKENGVLFDMPRFVRNLEQGFCEVLSRLPHGA